ncbi:hypothetical protein BSKO_07211 [Bryopsis sp. KO-2023]|nr:hypothetical protein BSKO_07211 [Bryopsis sp. KO-2023]
METGVELEVFPDQHDFEVAENLSGLEALLKYCRSPEPARRLPFIKAIPREALCAEVDSLTGEVLPLVQELCEDSSEDIRMSAAGILEPLGQSIHGRQPAGHPAALGTVVDCSFNLMRDSSMDVREYALAATTGLAGLLDADRQEKLFGPAVEGCLASDDVSDRISGVRLLGRLCEQGIYLGTEELVVQWLVRSVEDESSEVRQGVGEMLPMVAVSLKQQTTFSECMTCFVQLTEDKVWTVRKACAQSFPKLMNVLSSLSCSLETTKNILACHHKLCVDKSNWVKMAAVMSLGPVIVQLDPSLLEPDLLKFYSSLPSLRFGAVDTTVVLSCACHLPGVVVGAGKENWPYLRDLYMKLLESPDERVRYTLACSAHEIANILPDDVVMEDVVPGVKKMMTDKSSHVRAGMAKYLAPLLERLPSECHQDFLENLHGLIAVPTLKNGDVEDGNGKDDNTEKIINTEKIRVCHDTRDWRVRKIVVEQVARLATIVAPQLTLDYVLPCAFKLCSDSVAFVRMAAADQLAKVISLSEEFERHSTTIDDTCERKTPPKELGWSDREWDCVRQAVCSKMEDLGRSERFVDRCLCGVVTAALAQLGTNALENMGIGELITTLQNDSVLDVRLAFREVPQLYYPEKKSIKD